MLRYRVVSSEARPEPRRDWQPGEIGGKQQGLAGTPSPSAECLNSKHFLTQHIKNGLVRYWGSKRDLQYHFPQVGQPLS